MSNVLVIVESPAKAKTISRFLGSRKYIVKSSMGHVRDLPKSQWGVDVNNGFKPKYITIRGKGSLVKELKAAAKKSKAILLATDPDREGEAIAWHLQQLLEIDPNSNCRIEFNEITKNAIQKAIKEPRKIDMNRVDAQQARRILDRLVGYSLSPLLWKKVKKGLSAGRVQSVAVRLICDREDEISEFIPEEFWTIGAILKKEPDSQFEAKLIKIKNVPIKISSAEEKDNVVKELQGQKFLVSSVKKKEKKRNPAAPFTTSSLQQEANKKLNFTVKKTMMLAQQLYEGIELDKKQGIVGLITYLRTDSTRISAEAQEEARNFILEQYGKDYVPEVTREYNTKKQAQDAHEAIRPTSVYRSPEAVEKFLTKDQFKLYKLIWDRFLASQMSPAVFDTTTVDIQAGDYLLRATGSSLKFAGFMKVYSESKENEEDGSLLPDDINKDDHLILLKLDPKQHFTQPPARYTEASLVKILEELGIGRPSTYAPIIDTILNRGYVIKEQKQFIPTELGRIVVDLLKEFFADIIDVEFTANLESNLDKTEEGIYDWKEVVRDFYEPFAKELEIAEKEMAKVELVEEVSDEICEKCGRNMVVKFGRYGKFLACPGFPECRNTKPFLEPLGIDCPTCKGQIVIRRSKKGRKFYGCSNYPDCDFVSWDQPTKERCPECGSMLFLKSGKKENKLICSKENCSYKTTIGALDL
ncbi:MAG: type I DNA topoisomerase [Zhaonellaceae bacterium]